ncbi:MAG: 2'-5' RNA ligase family protein [Lachnospiraceae bacterium]|nr:2'-5' RNA ligase family protein [Lachnospiraceae bacterium]
MYLITAYFDDETNKILQDHINAVAKVTGNHFMADNHVPPHMTLSALESRTSDELKEGFFEFADSISAHDIVIASVGMFFPYVLYAAPVPNDFLSDIPGRISEIYRNTEGVSVSRYYSVDNWMPHITVAKRLDRAQMLGAIDLLRDRFVPIYGKVVRVGLSEVNPHFDVESRMI